jgi:hypothetical protein
LWWGRLREIAFSFALSATEPPVCGAIGDALPPRLYCVMVLQILIPGLRCRFCLLSAFQQAVARHEATVVVRRSTGAGVISIVFVVSVAAARIAMHEELRANL